MSVAVYYEGPVTILQQVPTAILEKWYNRLEASADMIYERIMTKIPDVNAYMKYLADPSAEVWKHFVSDYWPNADMIRLKQNVKVHSAGDRYLKGVISAYVTEKIFQKNVAMKKDRLEQARFTLSGVGVRYMMGWGPEYKAVGAITGDYRIKQYITSSETFQGEPVLCFPPTMVKFIRPTLIAKLTQGLVYASYALQTGLVPFVEKIVADVNKDLQDFVNAYKLSEFSEVSIGLEYKSNENKLYVFAKAVKS